MILATHTWGSQTDPPALLVHGAVDSWETWWRVGPWLADRGFHVIAVDTRGQGESQMDPSSCDRSLSTMADDLVETVEMLRPDFGGVELLVGHSLGAITGLVCAVEHPGWVQRLVLEDGPSGPSRHDPDETSNRVRGWIYDAREDPDAMLAKWLAAPPWPDQPPTTDEVRVRLAAVAAADPLYLPEVIAGYPRDPFSIGARCKTVTLVMVGRKELHSGLVDEDRERFMRTLAHGTLAKVEGAGHHLHQASFDEFASALVEWLDAVATAPAPAV
jgi:pimeloyl-ACP methyl ester carboxylesterase